MDNLYYLSKSLSSNCFCYDINIYNTLNYNNEKYFKLVIISNGYSSAKINKKTIPICSPSIICLNETDTLQLSNSSLLKGVIILFHPCIIDSKFTFDNIRNLTHDFSPSDINNILYL